MRYGSLFSGAGGLDMAAEQWTGATCAWTCEQDPHASIALAAHGTAPNLGDITDADWSQVEPVDVICGGFPCQDISNAGKRAGITGARSGLWSFYADAVRVLRPRLVLVENVGALLVRGLGPVLGDLAALGYDATWGCVRASDAGAPHRRERVFILATDAMRDRHAPISGGVREDGSADRRGASADRRGPALLPTPTSRDWKGGNQRGDATCLPGAVKALLDGDDLGTRGAQRPVGVTDESAAGIGDEVVKVSGELFGVGVVGCGDGHGDLHGSHDDSRDRGVKLLPTPAAGAFNDSEDPQSWLDRAERLKEKHGNGNGAGMPLAVAVKLLPTPRVQQGRNATSGRTNPDSEHHDGWTLNDVAYADKWGDYTPAIARWEHVLGRPAPEPVDDKGRLSPVFVEWLMGWPDGWVTHLDLKRTAQLRILGNGVVPQQALLAFDALEYLAVTS